MDAPASRKIILVEDDIYLGELLTEALTGRGYKVDWYVRARLAQSVLILMNDRGLERNFPASKVDGYEFALVDWRLKGSALEGHEVTRELTSRAVPVIAISGLPWLNDHLVESGAIGGIVKFEIFTHLIKGRDLLKNHSGCLKK